MNAIRGIDWSAPWLTGWHSLGRELARATLAHDPADAPVANALNALASAQCPVRFVSQSTLLPGTAYEAFIRDSGQVPTRDNLHDFFNGLAWLHFPQTKARLNALQASQIAQWGVGQHRGPVRDALTVFDENAAFLQAPAPIWEALETRQWSRLFIDLRPLWMQCHLTLFGHALLEKLVAPRKPIVAHVYRWPTGCGLSARVSLPGLDETVAASLTPDWLASKPFVALPVLGVPGWWSHNEDPAFYDDPTVFRPVPVPALMR
jgi:hypothetical protein